MVLLDYSLTIIKYSRRSFFHKTLPYNSAQKSINVFNIFFTIALIEMSKQNIIFPGGYVIYTFSGL